MVPLELKIRTLRLKRHFLQYGGFCIVLFIAMCTFFAQSRPGNVWEHCKVVNDRHLFRSFPRTIWSTFADGSKYSNDPTRQSFSSMDAGMQTTVKTVASTAAAIARKAACRAGNSSSSRLYASSNGKSFLVASEVDCTNGEHQNYIVGISGGALPSCTVSYSRTPKHNHLVIVVPYSGQESGRKRSLVGFLSRFADILRRPGSDYIRLVIGAPGNESRVASRLIAELKIGHAARTVKTGTDAVGKFSRSVSLRDAISSLRRNDVVGVVDVDLRIGENYCRACRSNAVQGSQVWFPAMFFAYRNATRVAVGTGIWAEYAYGHACFYRSDYDAVGGFGKSPETAYFGWGGEDDDFVARFRRRYLVFRSYEPDLFHVWHRKNCERNKNYKNCMNMAKAQLGGQRG